MQEAGVGKDESGLKIVGGKQYSSRSGSAGISWVDEAGGEQGRNESVIW